MRARVFKLGLLLLLIVPLALCLGLAALLERLHAVPVMVVLLLLPPLCMAGAGLLPDT